MQKHLVPRVLAENNDVEVVFATKSCRKAVLFIHGFTGDAIKTWADFHELLPGTPSFDGYDLYFYGYDGLRVQVNASANLFRTFLDRMLGQTEDFLVSNLPFVVPDRGPGFAYDRLLIVGHSLGAVISRRALLDARDAGAAWLDNVELALFAPAHSGASIAALAMEAADFGFLKPFSALARMFSPLIGELQPGSALLKRLADEVVAATQNGASPYLRAKLVVTAEYDDVVKNDRFPADPPSFTIPDSTHSSVCKPRANFLLPIQYLERCL